MKLTNKEMSFVLDIMNIFLGNYIERYQHISIEEYGKESWFYISSFTEEDKSNITKMIRSLINNISKVGSRINSCSDSYVRAPITSRELYWLLGEEILQLHDDKLKNFVEYMYLRESLGKVSLDYIDPTTIGHELDLNRESRFMRDRRDRFKINTKETRFTFSHFKDERFLDELISLRHQVEDKIVLEAHSKIDSFIIKHCDLAKAFENLLSAD